jgi:serine/threonine-protein kinase HipA
MKAPLRKGGKNPRRPPRVSAATVRLWGREVGAVAWDRERSLASFEYSVEFLRDGFDIAPLTMPRRPGIFSFPGLNPETYFGLPGLAADSLPDRFGNSLIDTWLAREGRNPDDFSPVERLCYIGSRGMGALEFKPALRTGDNSSVAIELDRLVDLAQMVVDGRTRMLVRVGKDADALDTIIRVGTSAGGARAKALVAWNPRTNEVRSGQVSPPAGFEPWILKFDGVVDRTLGSPKGYGRIEFAYHRMATAAGIAMSPCRLLEEGGRAHFMTRRFDRGPKHEKLHMQSLCGLAHYDYNRAGSYGYEQAFSAAQRIGLGYDTLEELFRRMAFNVVARNQDDHTKNIAFLMDSGGSWGLSPAFDLIWAYNAGGPWTSRHQMTINGKRDDFSRSDLLAVGKSFGVRRAGDVLDAIVATASRWKEFADEAGVPAEVARSIAKTHRLKMK